MKKRISQNGKNKNRFLNKLGMTYVELLCALSLLSLIVVMFTPMLLSSYENLYIAGETVEQVYDSKEELEEGLATRYSVKTVVFDKFNLGLNNLQTNADLLFSAINVNGKKVVSSLKQGLETVFGNARASVDIISPKVVYDDKSNHDVMIQTSGIEYSKVLYGSYSAKYGNVQETADAAFLAAHKANIAAGGKGVIFIEVMIPDKAQNVSGSGSTTEEAVYLSSNIATLRLYQVENQDAFAGSASTSGDFSMLHTDNYGRIKFNISGRTGTPLDFTQSPIKINVYYVNPREQVKECSDYLIIDPPTMIFAGDANSNVDYYTSAGVTEKDGTYKLEVEARKMRTANSGYLTSSDTPGSKGVRIQTVTWVQGDENAKLKPYYVMAGTNSGVYRMYNYRVNTTINDVFGISGATDTPEGTLVLSDGSLANPSFWSGEMSDQYSFQTLDKASTYGAAEDNKIDCSAPYNVDNDHLTGSVNVIGTQYNKFDKNLRYSMHYNSYRTGYKYASQQSRKISYVLTEKGNSSFRIAGKKYEEGDFTQYHQPWENEYYKYTGSLVTANTEDDRALYFGGKGSLAANNDVFDKNLAYLRLATYSSINPLVVKDDNTVFGNGDTIKFRFVEGGEFWSPVGKSEESLKEIGWKDRENYITSKYGCSVNVTSAIYLPGSGSKGQGQVIYFGTVPSYALIRQCSDPEDDTKKEYNNNKATKSAATMYLVTGTQGDGTTIYRMSYSGSNGANRTEGVDAQNLMRSHIYASPQAVTPLTDPTTFYNKKGDSVTYKYDNAGLEFTLGYCSRWRMTVGDVTYNGTNEETKSYEKYYRASNPSAGYTRKPSTLNGGGLNNLYYDVWFPGEYYNLTQTATLDEITVAVGYALSGSTFMSQSWCNGSYYGTALGSIYNDGVLAAYVSEEAGGRVFTAGLGGKGERNAIFQNLLYYKSPAYKNGTNTTTHERENVRFTAVDLVSFTDTAGNKTYMAVYGDNHGKLYFSNIATSKVTNTSGNEGAAVESNVVLRSATTGNALTNADMIELTYNDADPYAITGTNSLSTIFSEITSIEASEDMVIVTGPALNGGVEQFAVLERPDSNSNTWTMKRVYNGTFKGVVNNAMILGDYYYIAGDGWVAAASLDTIKSTPAGGTIKNKTESLSASAEVTGSSTNKDHLLWVGTQTNIHAIGGRLTEG